MSLWQLIYASNTTSPLTDPEIDRLLTQSRTDNKKTGITGMLIYHQGSFLQVLEGPKQAVEALFGKISGDTRHKEIAVLARGAVDTREFADWTMGFVDVLTDPRFVEGFQGYNIPLKNLSIKLDEARKLLHTFQAPPFRDSVNH